jgi:hypothetical protein
VELNFLSKICVRFFEEVIKFGGILSPISDSSSSSDGLLTLASEPLSVLITPPPSSSFLHSKIFFFLALNEFFLTISHLPITQQTQVQSFIDSPISKLISTALISLGQVTTLEVLTGISSKNVGGSKKSPNSPSPSSSLSSPFISYSAPSITASSLPDSSPSSTPSSISIILSSVYHSLAYSSL